MKLLRAVGLVLGGAVVWSITLWLARRYPVEPPAAIFTTVAAVGLPAFFGGALAYRWRLWQPPLWSALGYCLGSGVATAALMPPGQTLEGSVRVALAHAGSLTVLVPDPVGTLRPWWANLVWLAGVVIIALYGIEAYRGGGPVQKQ